MSLGKAWYAVVEDRLVVVKKDGALDRFGVLEYRSGWWLRKMVIWTSVVSCGRGDGKGRYLTGEMEDNNWRPAKRHSTMVEDSQEYRLQYWATRSSVCSFARTAHSFACSRLLASLAPSAALTRSLARSLRSLPRSWESDFF